MLGGDAREHIRERANGSTFTDSQEATKPRDTLRNSHRLLRTFPFEAMRHLVCDPL